MFALRENKIEWLDLPGKSLGTWGAFAAIDGTGLDSRASSLAASITSLDLDLSVNDLKDSGTTSATEALCSGAGTAPRRTRARKPPAQRKYGVER
jgi:hypothetical protein